MRAKRSPARAALANAIVKHEAAVSERQANEAARDRAAEILRASEAALEIAQAAVATAREAHVARIAEAASVGVDVATAPDLKARNARLDEAVAQDDVDAARDALAGFERALEVERSFTGDPVDPVTLAAKHVDMMARAVIAAEVNVAKMIAEADAAYHDALAKRASLARLVDLQLVDTQEHGEGLRQIKGGEVPYLAVCLNAFTERTTFEGVWPRFLRFSFDEPTPPGEATVSASCHRWEDTLERLRSDADAEMPS